MQQRDSVDNVLRAGIWYTVGNILAKGISFLTIPVFTMLMTTEQYGIYNSYAAYVSIISVIVSLGLPSSVRNARYDFKDDEKTYYSGSILLIVLFFAVIFAAVILFGSRIVPLFGIEMSLILISVVNSACTALQSYYNNILTINYKYKSYLSLSIFYSLTSVLGSVIVIKLVFPDKSALGRAIGNMIPMIMIGSYVLVKIWSQRRPMLKKDHVRYGMRFGLPLIANDLSSLVLAQFDRIMILHTVGESESGIYSFAYNIAVIYQVITGSAESAWMPWLFNQISCNRKANIRKIMKLYFCTLTLGTLILVLVSPEVVKLLSGRDYWDSIAVVIPIVLAMYFFAIAAVSVGVELFYKKTLQISVCTFVVAAVNILLNAIFIPQYGYVAAAYTTLFCYFIYAVIHLIAAEKLYSLRLWNMPVVAVSVLITMIVSAFGAGHLENPFLRYILLAIIIVAIVCIAVCKRNDIKMVVFDFMKESKKEQ